jgi:hypothetical protein
MKKTLLAILIALAIQTNAQQLDMEWLPNPVLHKIANEKFLKESAIIIKEDVQLEVSVPKGSDVSMTRKIHKIVRVNDEKGIEMFNKVKIGYNPDFPIYMIKARTITPAGKVIELKTDAFKEVKDEDGSMNKIFALEGVEKGAEIEYVYHMKQRYAAYGTYTLQDVIPTLENQFEFVAPKHLIYEMKGYNNVQVGKDTMMNDKNCIMASSKNLEGIEEEKYATYYPHFARVEYTLAYNVDGKGKGIRVYTWDDIAKNINTNFTTFTEKELKSGKKLLDDKEYKKCSNTLEKVQWIEQFIKTSFVQQEYVPDENASNIDFILKNKVTDEFGFKRLFALLFKVENIDYELGFTTDRFRKAFDYNFLNLENIKECYMYFPDLKQYLAPNEVFYRMPFIPSNWCGNASMFVKVLKLGDVSTASAENRKLPEMSAEKSYHNHDVEVSFNTTMDTSIIKLKNDFAGYNELDVLPICVFLENEKREDAVKEIIRLSEKDEKIENIKYVNNDYKSFQLGKPLQISADIYATNNIEKAGNKYLYKIGDLIGRQAEMYQEKERKFDLEIPNAHQYTRKLKVHIPEGYKVNNADKLKMKVVSMNNGKESCSFTSDYTINGNILEVNCFEIYHTSFSPISEYETYKKVINAAADFNKIVIVFEKL